MVFTRKTILSILVISLLGSATLAYGLSTVFLFNFDVEGGPFGSTSNSTHILVANNTSIAIYNLSGIFEDKFNATNPPRDVAINSTHVFVMTTANEVELFDLSGNPDSSPFNDSDLFGALGIAINSTHVFVADDGLRVAIFDSSGNLVDFIPTDANLADPVNVAVDSNGRIIVLDDGGPTAIDIYDSSGDWIKSFGTIAIPVGIDVDSNDRIIVSDAATSGVQVFDSSGNLLTTFGSFGSDDGEFTFPSRLTVDSNDRIIVPDDALNDRIQVFSYVSESSTGGGGNANKHKTAPTSGLDWTTHRQIVTDGFRVNDFKVTLDDNWWTDFPEKQIIVGVANEFEIKTFAQNGGLMIQELCFGLDEIGLINTAEVCLEAWYDYQQNIVDVKVIQDTNVINEDLLKVSTSEEYCDVDGMKCTVTLFYDVVFMEHLKNKVMAIQSVDQSRRTMMPTSLNDGIVILGESLNPMLTRQIAGIEKGEGLITITQVEKYSDLWIAEDGRIFEMFGESDSFKLVNQSYERNIDSGTVKSRNHSAHSDLLLWQEKVATGIFDSSLIQGSDEGFIPPIIDEDGIDHRTETLQKLKWYQK